MEIDSSKIQTISDDEWTFLRMSQQLGDTQTQEKDMIVYQDDRFIIKNVKYSQQSQKMFEEIIQNAIDNYIKHPVQNYYINVAAQERSFSIQNNGYIFSLRGTEKDQDISRIFSFQRTSDQYTSEVKQTAGMNGLGAKLVNLCSSQFQIKVHNNGFKYVGTWKDCKSSFSQQIGEESDKKYFCVSVVLAQPGTVKIVQGQKINLDFCDLNLELIKKYMIDLQLCYPDIKFILNKDNIPRFSIKQFLEMNNIFDYVVGKYNKLTVCIFKTTVSKEDKKEIQPPLFKRYTIINGIQSNEGQHYDSLRSRLSDLSKVRNLQIGMLFMGSSQNIDYGEQVKTRIIKMEKLDPTNDMIEFVKKLDQEKELKRDTKVKFNKKLTEANNVKNKNSECTLILTEGDSASCLFKSIQSQKPDFFDNYGLFPLRGKIQGVNKMNEDINQIENEEIKNIINIIGLKKTEYDETSIKSLRYQKILIATDYDVDGYHICGLLISFIYKYWPSLIDLQFLQRFTTPIITAMDGKKEIEFFSLASFNQYEKELTHVNYYKGLGSFTREQAKQIGNNFGRYIKVIIPGSEDFGVSIQKMFVNPSSDRKELINQYEYRDINYGQNQLKIEDCMNQVVEYSVESLQRAIPSFIDGLKESQRKIIYWVMKHGSDKIKVSQLSGKVSGDLDYHHGEVSLQEATILLAQNFAGSNNCNLLDPDGQFGDRKNPQSYGSPRYIYVRKSKWINKIYKESDSLLYKYKLSDDNADIEPESLFPIIPIQMVNGATGIATGWSTFMPCYKLEDIVNYIKLKLNNKKTKQIIPCYNDYQGTIKMEESKMICVGSYEFNKETSDLQIYDTTIDTSLSKLEEFLKGDDIKQEHVKNEGILIKGIDNELLKRIYKKFLYSQISLSNMTFVDGTKIKQYDNSCQFLDEWIEQRLKIYERRKQQVLIQIIKQYVLFYNYNRFLQENVQQYLSSNQYKEQLQEKLSYFAPNSWIQNIKETNLEIVKKELENKKDTIQSKDFSEYNYITQKTIGFFNKHDLREINKIEQQYNEYLQKSIKQIWEEELDELMK